MVALVARLPVNRIVLPLTLLAAAEDGRVRTEVLHLRTTAGLEFWDLTETAREQALLGRDALPDLGLDRGYVHGGI